MRLVQVAVPVPQLDALSYSIPDEFPDPVPGARVLVPLGKRVLTGVVCPWSAMRDPGSETIRIRAPGSRIPAVGSGSRTPDDADPGLADPGSRIPDPGSVKPIIDILDQTPLLPPTCRPDGVGGGVLRVRDR